MQIALRQSISLCTEGCRYPNISRGVRGINYEFIPDIYPGVHGHVILAMNLTRIYVLG